MTPTRLLLGTLFGFSASLVACSGSFDLNASDVAENAVAGSGAGGSASGGPTGGRASGSAPGGTAGAGGADYWPETDGGGCGQASTPSCEAYKNEPDELKDYKIRIVNQRTSPIYFGIEVPHRCGGAVQPFSIWRSGTALNTTGDGCGFSCETAMKDGFHACVGACVEPKVTRLNPGGVLEQPWQGAALETVVMPNSCAGGTVQYEGEFTCSRSVNIPLDSVTVHSTAWTEGSCLTDGDCSCVPAADGTCTLSNARVQGTALEQSVEFVDGVAVITFHDPLPQ